MPETKTLAPEAAKAWTGYRQTTDGYDPRGASPVVTVPVMGGYGGYGYGGYGTTGGVWR